ncbi:MAG: hypothetical protein H7210_12275 [Pyrinomonadaceae bacterium]|nr:hypothetical protein [Phycisphaerales bacterium]
MATRDVRLPSAESLFFSGEGTVLKLCRRTISPAFGDRHIIQGMEAKDAGICHNLIIPDPRVMSDFAGPIDHSTTSVGRAGASSCSTPRSAESRSRLRQSPAWQYDFLH